MTLVMGSFAGSAAATSETPSPQRLWQLVAIRSCLLLDLSNQSADRIVKVKVTTPPRAYSGRRETYGLLLSSGPTTECKHRSLASLCSHQQRQWVGIL